MGRLSIPERNIVVHLHHDGHGYGRIKKILEEEHQVTVTKKAIRNICKKFELTHTLANKRRTSHSILHTEDHEAFVNRCMEDTPELSASQLVLKIQEEFGLRISASAVSKYRRKIGWGQHTTRYCQMIRHVNKEKRVTWCQEQLDTDERFQNVVFTDESRIEMSRMSKRSFRKRGGAVPRVPKPKHPLAVLVWAGISMNGATPLIIFSGFMDSVFYQTEILQNGLIPFGQQRYPAGYRLYQDNDPKHTSRSTQSFMEENDINWFKSPAESPDLNPIENLWAEMKHYISSRVKPRTKQELEDGLQEFWLTVTAEKCRRYISHIHKVIPKVIECNGGPTGF